MSTPNNSSTLEEAKKYLRDNFSEGVPCPCCTQLVKLYGYKINVGMVVVLIKMYKFGKEWVHPLIDLKTNNGDYAKLRFWGLVEPKSKEPTEDKKASGYWRITEEGKKFVEGNKLVKEKAFLFNNKCYGFKGKEITIIEALGKKFSYSELMSK